MTSLRGASASSTVPAVTEPMVELRIVFRDDVLANDEKARAIVELKTRIPVPLASQRGEQIIALADALCRAAAPLFGWAHLDADLKLAGDPNWTSAVAPKQVHQAHWLTIIGAPMVKQIGRSGSRARPPSVSRCTLRAQRSS